MSNDALFAIVAGGIFFCVFVVMVVITAIYEAIDELVEKWRK